MVSETGERNVGGPRASTRGSESNAQCLRGVWRVAHYSGPGSNSGHPWPWVRVQCLGEAGAARFGGA
jgi:hypothetical protein